MSGYFFLLSTNFSIVHICYEALQDMGNIWRRCVEIILAPKSKYIDTSKPG